MRLKDIPGNYRNIRFSLLCDFIQSAEYVRLPCKKSVVESRRWRWRISLGIIQIVVRGLAGFATGEMVVETSRQCENTKRSCKYSECVYDIQSTVYDAHTQFNCINGVITCNCSRQRGFWRVYNNNCWMCRSSVWLFWINYYRHGKSAKQFPYPISPASSFDAQESCHVMIKNRITGHNNARCDKRESTCGHSVIYTWILEQSVWFLCIIKKKII